MDEQSTQGGEAPDDIQARRVDAACDRFEAAWRAGRGPRIEDELGASPAGDREAMLRELLALDIELRRAAGEAPTASEYRARFPAYGGLIDARFSPSTREEAGIPVGGPRDDAARNLLLGILALQNNFVGRDGLLAAFNAWVVDRSRPLGRLLLDGGALDPGRLALLEALATEHLKLHGDDPGRSLAALSSLGSARDTLERIDDPDVQATLTLVARGGEAGGAGSPGGEGRVGPRFRVLRFHRRGGLGEVFVARDEELNREVALKRIQDGFADDPASQARFVMEAEVTGRLEHPGIVPVYGLGSYADGRPYYAMRFVDGDSLKDAIDAYHRPGRDADGDLGGHALVFRRLLQRFVDVCEAVSYAHSRGVLHRDLKPGNVMLGRYGETLLVDWGLAKPVGRPEGDMRSEEATLRPSSASGSAETLPGTVLGTPAYMSPEQACGDLDALGPCSDVYSLGATLYCLLTGTQPIVGNDVADVLRRVRAGEFPPPRSLDPALDPALEAVCLKAMALRPEDRYPSPQAMADDVERWTADEPVSAWREPFSRRARRWTRRNRIAVSSAAFAMLAGLAGLGAVAAVQARANADLRRANSSVEAEKERVQARFTLARDAIRLYQGEVSDDNLLKERQFARIRSRLLRGAAGFYGRLEDLLKGEDDRESRLELGRAYDELARLTSAIGDKREALSILEKAVAFNEQTAAIFGDNPALTIAKADDLNDIALVKYEMGDMAGALAALERASALAGPNAPRGTNEAGAALGSSYHVKGLVLEATGKTIDAMKSYREALTARRPLADASPEDPLIQRDLAMTLNNLANLVVNTGDVPQALRLHVEALAIRRRMADAHPDDLRIQADLSLSHYNLGYTRLQSGQIAEALPPLKESLAIRRRLVEAESAVTDFQRDLARSLYLIGVALVQGRQWAPSLGPLAEAASIQQRLADANPGVAEIQGDLARAYNATAVVRANTGDMAGAMDSYRKAIVAFRAIIAAAPAATQPRNDLAGTLSNLSSAALISGDPAAAARPFEESLAIFRSLADADPADPRRRRAMAACHSQHAQALGIAGLVTEALTSYGEALKVLAPLADSGPREPQDRLSLAEVYENIGKLRARIGRTDDARGSLHEAVAAHERLIVDYPAVPGLLPDLASSLAALGHLERRSGRTSDAQSAYRRAVAALQRMGPAPPNVIYSLACYRALLSGVEGGDTGEAGRAMDDLRRSLAAGYSDLANIRSDTDLDALRGREDFRLLMLDLDFPADPFLR